MPAKSTIVKDLQMQCEAEGLDATGTKADLIGRLRDNQRNREVISSQSQDGMECDAILVTRSELGDEGTKRDGKDTLEQAL
jgi:hypothetical protein